MHRYIATWKELGDCPGDKMLFQLNYIKYIIEQCCEDVATMPICERTLNVISNKISDIIVREVVDEEFQREIVALLSTEYQNLQEENAPVEVLEVIKNAIDNLNSNDDTVYTGIQKEMIELLMEFDKSIILSSIKQIDRSIVGNMPKIIDRARQICWEKKNGLMLRNIESENELTRGV